MNAVILAAGTSSRFVPLSWEKPKGLLNVRGEVLIERQIRQLKEAGVGEIIVVVGYKGEMFRYLAGRWGVRLVWNEDFERFNNTSSMIRVLDRLEDTFICCSDIYYSENVFLVPSNDSYYSAQFTEGVTTEYCLYADSAGFIDGVSVGGQDAWCMTGHAFFNRAFSEAFKNVLFKEYPIAETKRRYWEDVFIDHLHELPMRIRKYPDGIIHEFDSLEELRVFDPKYLNDSGSVLLKKICEELNCQEQDIVNIRRNRKAGIGTGFYFDLIRDSAKEGFEYDAESNVLMRKSS